MRQPRAQSLTGALVTAMWAAAAVPEANGQLLRMKLVGTPSLGFARSETASGGQAGAGP